MDANDKWFLERAHLQDSFSRSSIAINAHSFVAISLSQERSADTRRRIQHRSGPAACHADSGRLSYMQNSAPNLAALILTVCAVQMGPVMQAVLQRGGDCRLEV